MIRPLPKKDLDEVMEQTNGTKQFDEEILDPILENVQSLNLEGKFDDAAEDEVITEGETGVYNQKILDALAELERNKDTHFNREVLAHCSPKFLACLDNIENPEYSEVTYFIVISELLKESVFSNLFSKPMDL